MMLIMLMMIFVLGQWHWTVRLHLNRIRIISETLMEMHLMKMSGPDASHWEELSSLALGFQIGAFATVPVIVGKNTLPEIFFLAVVFIAGVFTL